MRLRFADPEGLGHELAVRAAGDAPLAPSTPRSRAELALQGFDGVRAYSARPRAQRRRCSSSVLGATRSATTRWELRGDAAAATIAYDPPPAEPGRQSAGTVHHVAWGTTVAEHPRWEEHLRGAGVRDVGHHRPPLLPLDLLPRAQRRALRDRRRRPRLHRRRLPLEQLGSAIILPPQLEPQRERDRGAPDAAARPARAAQPGPLGFAVRRIAYSIGAPFGGPAG